MFVYCTIDPEVFTNSYLTDINVRNNLEFFLKSIKENNTLIVIDPDGEIENSISTNVSGLSVRMGQQIQIIYNEILKTKRYKIIRIINAKFNYPKIKYSSIDIIKLLFNFCKLDGILTTSNTASRCV